jgi:hypothetical protein
MSRRATAASLLCLAVLVSAGAAASATVPGFRSPSGNIKCLFLAAPSHDLLCTIGHANYSATLQARCMSPGGAGVDWHGFILSATGKAVPNCSGGILYTGRPSYARLAYGRTLRHGAFTCKSRRAGVTCTNTHGHGLFVSRESFRIW